MPTAGTLAPPTSTQNFIINKHKINQRETILLIFIDCLDWVVSDGGAPDQGSEDMAGQGRRGEEARNQEFLLMKKKN